jgi:hypothetical protein
MKRKGKSDSDEMRPEYTFDYAKGVRGKYYRRIMEEGTNVVLLDADVQKAFPDSASVNQALRTLMKAKRVKRKRAAA